MGWTYLLLIALLLRIAAAAEAQSNPFTVAEWNVVAGTTFTITWEPTTEGTVTISLVSFTDDGDNDADGLTGRHLYAEITNSGSCDWAVTDNNSSLLYSIQLQSDIDWHLANHSPSFHISSNAESGGGNRDATQSTTTDILSETPTPTADDADASPSTTTESPLVTSDVPTSTRSPSRNSDSTTAGVPIADTPTISSLLPSESSASSSSELSTGAAAGIGVGATLSALILLAIGGFFWWRGRKRSFGLETNASASTLETAESKSKKRASELEGTGVIPIELEGTPRAELAC